ncbi:MAG: acyl-CoA dehydrogenase family protein [Polyangiaceae bacterium]
MTTESWLHDPRLVEGAERLVRELHGERSPANAELRAGLRRLHGPAGLLFEVPAGRSGLARIARTIASVAWVDLSLAFSLWSHRMVLEYVHAAEHALPDELYELLARAELVGSSALASGMAHHVSGAALPISLKEEGGRVNLTGKVRWASNLFEEGFLLITAIARDGSSPQIVALPAGTPGFTVDPFPSLLELQATRSASLTLSDVALEPGAVLASEFDGFIRRVRPPFLLLQSSFCWGLAARSLHEAARRLTGPINEVFVPEQRALVTELARIEAALEQLAGSLAVAPSPIREWVLIRLQAAQLAGAATRLESKLVGGSGFTTESATARRLREAAFLPIQSPTEGQLLWELSRSS